MLRTPVSPIFVFVPNIKRRLNNAATRNHLELVQRFLGKPPYFLPFTKGNNFEDVLFASVGNKFLPERSLIWTEIIFSNRRKFFPSSINPTEKWGKMKMAELIVQKVKPFSYTCEQLIFYTYSQTIFIIWFQF